MPAVAPSPNLNAADRDDGIYLLDDEGHWATQSGQRVVSSHDQLLAACEQMLDSAEKRGFAAGEREGFRRAVALIPQVVDELLSGRDLGDLPPSAVRWLVQIIAGRLMDRRPAEPLGPTVVEGGLGI